MYDVSVVVRGAASITEDQLAALQRHLEDHHGIEEGVAVIFWPGVDELGICFQIKEEVLGELLQPAAARKAA